MSLDYAICELKYRMKYFTKSTRDATSAFRAFAEGAKAHAALERRQRNAAKRERRARRGTRRRRR